MTSRQKVILFGCSFTETIHHDMDSKDEEKWEIKNLGIGGNSNQRILTQVYDYVNSTEYQPTDILNIQWTYTNRFWTPSKLQESHKSFHGLKSGGLIYANPQWADKLQTFIELYTVLFYNNKLYFEHHLKQIDMLRTYLDAKGVKYIHYLHSKDSYFFEVAKNDYRGWNLISDSHGGEIGKVDLKKYNLSEIGGEETMGIWSLKNNYNISEENVHLDYDGNVALLKILYDKWNSLL